MKKIFFSILVCANLFFNAQQTKNSLLEGSFWKSTPTVESVKAEVAKGNNPSQSNQNNMDVVTTALLNNASVDVIAFLLEQPGNSVNKITHEGRTYLHWASMKGNAEIINFLLSKGSDINLEEEHGLSPAYLAANNGGGTVAVFEVFVKNGLNLKKKYKDGASILLSALPNDKDFSLTEYFVSKGLSVKDTDANGNTAIDYAARGGNITAIKKLLPQGVKFTDNALVFAAQGGRRSANGIDIYKYLVDELKIKPTVVTKNGENVLHLVAKKQDQAEVVKYFVDKGVDVNKVDNEGNTPFINAASSKDLDVITTLFPKVKNINAVNAKGESALTNAVKGSSGEVVAFLLDKGADIKIEDKAGNNLAYYWVQSYRAPRGGFGGNTEQKDDLADKLKVLQAKGLNFSAPQKDGNTLYHIAIAKNDLNILKKLEPLQVDINAKNKEGMTILQKAALTSKDDKILKYLLSVNAKKDIKTEFGETAFDLAKDNEYLSKNNVNVDFLK